MSFGLAQQLIEQPVVRAGIRLTLEDGTFQRPRLGPYLDWIGAVEDLLRRGAAERELRPAVDPASASRFIVSAFTGVQLVAQVLEERRRLLDRVDEMWELLLPGPRHPQEARLLPRVRVVGAQGADRGLSDPCRLTRPPRSGSPRRGPW